MSMMLQPRLDYQTLELTDLAIFTVPGTLS